jgi:LysM repeat protein
LLLFALAAMLVYGWARLGTGPEPVAATVRVVTGQISILRADAGADETVVIGETATVQRGDGIVTGMTGEAILSVGQGDAFLGSNAELLVLEMQKGSLLRGLAVSLALERGEIDAEMDSLGLGGSFVLETDIVTVKGPAFRCVVREGESVTVEVSAGLVSVTQGRDSVTLSRGQRLTAVLGRPLLVEGEPVKAPTRTPRSSSTRPPLIDLDKTLFPVPGETGATALPTVAPSGTYTVRAGDTLFSIAQKYDLDWEALWDANRDTVETPDMLREGQVLRIPER